MGHGTNTRGYEGDGSPRDAAGMATGADEEGGPARWKRALVGAAQGVASVNPQQPGAVGSSVNAASQVAATMLNRAQQPDEAALGKMPAWYIIQRQREEEQRLRQAQSVQRAVPAL